MTSDFSFMTTSSLAKSLPLIYATNGNCMNVSHIGTIDTPSLSLPHTYCIPNLTFNLVSVGHKVGRLFELISFQPSPPSSISAPVTKAGTLVQRFCPHTSQQNGRVECKHRHILDSVCALLLSSSYPKKFWGEAALTSMYHQPSSFFHSSKHFFFQKTVCSNQPSAPNDVLEPTLDIPLHRSTQIRKPPIHLQDYHYFSTIVFLVEPTSYQEASTEPLWQKAMSDESQALEMMHTWDYVNLPPRKSPIGWKWIYKIKTRSDGNIERYKAFLVAKVAATKQWPLFHMDVKNAFLKLSEEAS
ncbi:retrotransposon protein [Cucumis melo var. makuwa]|uniref:Retrotransposon protein n=1 Tax=Cucumis melo var. makuwa TaxID=1194695 RepID=A0A5D3D8K3_CUCMM|nr:retrotransposon protein [Cucumis melo var. makuwa]TYK19891.1 retrotransposon protein [Cucumis melo var. makuwa]